MCCEVPSQEARREAYKRFYLNQYLSSSTTIFPALDTDYNDIIICKEKTLLEICMDRLLCDVYIMERLVKRIPKVLQYKLIDRALETNRILSVKFLLKGYPGEEFVFPIPDFLKNCAVVQSRNLETPIVNYIGSMKDKLNIVVSAFESVVREKDPTSSWHILNLNQLPHEFLSGSTKRVEYPECISLRKEISVPTKVYSTYFKVVEEKRFQGASGGKVNSILKSLCKFFGEDHSYNKQYVVKGAFMFIEEQDYINFTRSKDKLFPHLNLVLTGIYALRIPVNQQLIDVFDRVKDQELEYIALDYLMTNVSKFTPSIRRFKNLTSLFLTNIKQPNADDLDGLAQIIYELPKLRNLGISSADVPNRLQTLLMKNCKMEDTPQAKKVTLEGDPSCCAVHRGNLRFLDVSYCRLGNEDLECLKEYPFCINLKHLSIGSNERLQAEKLADCLEYMASNLVILDLYGTYGSFANTLTMQPLIDILDKFKMLKFLALGTVRFQDNQFRSFSKALFNIPQLKEIRMIAIEVPNDDLVDLAQSLLRKKGVHVLLK